MDAQDLFKKLTSNLNFNKSKSEQLKTSLQVNNIVEANVKPKEKEPISKINPIKSKSSLKNKNKILLIVKYFSKLKIVYEKRERREKKKANYVNK